MPLADPGVLGASAATSLLEGLVVVKEQEPEADLGQNVQNQEQKYLPPLVYRPEALGTEQEHDGVQAPEHYREYRQLIEHPGNVLGLGAHRGEEPCVGGTKHRPAPPC